MSESFVPAQYRDFVFLSPKQLQLILNVSKTKCYQFLREVSASNRPCFKVERIGASIRVQAKSFWSWYYDGDPSLAEGF